MLIQDFSLEPAKILLIIEEHKKSPDRQKMIDAFRYYEGDNVLISNVQKLYYSDKFKKTMPNPFKANEKIGYGFFGDMIDQEVFTLLDEPPQIVPKNENDSTEFLTDILGDDFGNALQYWAVQASTKGKAWAFWAFTSPNKGEFSVFESENVIEFVDEYTNELGGLYRFWEVATRDDKTKLIVEVYDLTGITIFKQALEGTQTGLVKSDFIPYKKTREVYYSGTIENPIPVKKIPVFKLKNNKKEVSDLTKNIQSKIDAIDLAQSDFLNNLKDFSDIYWAVIGANRMTSDEMEDFLLSVASRKNIILENIGNGAASATPHTIPIPYEARDKFVEIMKSDLMTEAGVIDRSSASGVTATEIRFATYRLRRRVSKFEYWLHKATRELIDAILKEINSQFEYTLSFNKNYPDNATELLTNMQMAQADMSQVDRLRILQQVGLIQSVEDTQKALEEEVEARYSGVQDLEELGLEVTSKRVRKTEGE